MASPGLKIMATEASNPNSTQQREDFLSLPRELRQQILLQSYELKIMTVESESFNLEPPTVHGPLRAFMVIGHYLQQRRALELAAKINIMHSEHELNLVRIWKNTLMKVDDRLYDDLPYVHKLWEEEIDGLMEACRDGSVEIVVK